MIRLYRHVDSHAARLLSYAAKPYICICGATFSALKSVHVTIDPEHMSTPASAVLVFTEDTEGCHLHVLQRTKGRRQTEPDTGSLI